MSSDGQKYDSIDGTEEWVSFRNKRPGKIFETKMGLTVFVWYNSKIEAMNAYGMDMPLFEKLVEKGVDLIEINNEEIAIPIDKFKDEADIKKAEDDFYKNERPSDELIYRL